MENTIVARCKNFLQFLISYKQEREKFFAKDNYSFVNKYGIYYSDVFYTDATEVALHTNITVERPTQNSLMGEYPKSSSEKQREKYGIKKFIIDKVVNEVYKVMIPLMLSNNIHVVMQ